MADVILQSPYPPGAGHFWLKGNLHTHTSRSDGRLDIQDVVRRYRALRHDFLEISDHDRHSDYAGIDAGGMILIPGSEVTAGGPHVLDIGGSAGVEGGQRQRVIDRIIATGGLAVLCHPDWERAFDHIPIRQLRALAGYCGIEIYNGGVQWGAGGGLAVNKWDMLLSGGRTVWGLANDDAHGPEEIGRGWNVVCVGERSAAAILRAIRDGAFYASTGVTIESIECDGATLRVRAPDAEAIAIHGENGRRHAFVEAPEIVFDASDAATSYIRVDCFGRGERRAWSQPIILGGPDNDRLRALLAEKPVIRALPADRPPTLTGRIDDPLWQSAEPVRRFYRLPRAADPAVETEVRAIIAGQTLFLAVRCQEPEMAALRTAATAERGNIWSDDSIEVYFDPAGSGESYYYIQANAAGEAVLNNSATGRLNVGLVARPGRFDAGWTLELAIPLGELGGLPPGARAIGFNIHRNRTMDRGAMSWSWGGQSYHAPEHFGRLEF